MSKVIGIDLGTTNSVVSYMEGGQPAIKIMQKGPDSHLLLWLLPKMERLVGQLAKRQAVTNPERTIKSIKRYIVQTIELTLMEKILPLRKYLL